MTDYKVTAIGEILYDIYPEQKRLGGAPFNFIYHIWKILGKANFISSVGNDENGKEMFTHLKSIGFDTKHIYIDNGYPTGTVQVKLQNDKTPQFTISPECSYDYLILNEAMNQLIENGTDILYFGTLSTRSAISRKTIQSLFGKPHLKYFCDINLRHNFYTKELIERTLITGNVIKLNDPELEIIKKFLRLEQSNHKAIGQLLNDYNIDLIGLTHGESGAELFTKNEMNQFKTGGKTVVDTLGAGDAFAAVLCLGFMKQMPLAEINKLANEFAEEICMIYGAIPEDDYIYVRYRKIFTQQ